MAPGGKPALPHGWTCFVVDGDFLYYNEEAGVHQWEPPTATVLSEQQAIQMPMGTVLAGAHGMLGLGFGTNMLLPLESSLADVTKVLAEELLALRGQPTQWHEFAGTDAKAWRHKQTGQFVTCYHHAR